MWPAGTEQDYRSAPGRLATLRFACTVMRPQIARRSSAGTTAWLIVHFLAGSILSTTARVSTHETAKFTKNSVRNTIKLNPEE